MENIRMYKLLIADDDEIVCRGLGSCIPWKKYGIQVVGLVYDGEMALDYVERENPDIVIVDINMPFMDGMEFSYVVRQKYPDIKIILLTAYQEFAYAQKAVQLQVFAYLTKPFTNEEVLETVRRAQQVIEDEQEHRLKIRKNMEVIQEKSLEELTLYGSVEEEMLANSRIEEPRNYFQVGILYLRRIRSRGEKGTSALVEDEVALRIAADRLREGIRPKQDCGLFVQNSRIVLIFEYSKRSEGEKIREQMTKMMEIAGREDNVFLIGGAGRICHGIERLPGSYHEASYAVEQRFGYGNRSVILYSEVQFRTAGFEVELPQIRKKVQEGVQQRDSGKIREEIGKLFEKIRGMTEEDMAAVCFMLVELMRVAWEATEDDQVYEEFLKKSSVLLAEMMTIRSAADLEEAAALHFLRLYEYLDSQSTTDIEKRVNQAVEYIRECYPDPELNLNEVAHHVHLSASYLGNSLKKYKKISYVNLLNQVRIEHAKKLLARTDTKTYEVAFLVGFNSSQYFSSCFKKSTGMTPGAFREQALKNVFHD